MPFRTVRTIALAGTALFFATAAAQDVPSVEQAVPKAGQTAGAQGPRGYLAQTDWPDSLALLPPPPAPGSAAFARDEEATKAATRAPDSPRFRAAANDADLNPTKLAGIFSCAIGVTPSPQTTPALTKLLGKSVIDVALSTYKAKNHYMRVRPFVAQNTGTCFPPQEAMLRKDGSYPSGHSAIGWGWALLLTELFPARADSILQRGRDFGQSRVVCKAHWQSDVDAGRIVASAAVARLHADATFRADMEAARAEVAKLPPAPATPSATCAQEAAALAQ